YRCVVTTPDLAGLRTEGSLQVLVQGESSSPLLSCPPLCSCLGLPSTPPGTVCCPLPRVQECKVRMDVYAVCVCVCVWGCVCVCVCVGVCVCESVCFCVCVLL